MKKNTNFLKKCAAIAAIALAFVNLIMPRQSEFEVDTDAAIAVCVIDNDGDDDERPLDGTEQI